MENNMLKRDAYNELLELLNDGLNVKEVRELIFRAENKVINAGKTLVDRDPLNNLKNDDIDKAVKKVNAILLSERCRVDRIEDVYLNNMEEEVHELLIDKEFENKDIEI